MFGFGKKSKIKKTKTKEGKHGDHWDAIFGFETADNTQDIVMRYVERLAPVDEFKGVTSLKYKDGMFSVVGASKRQQLITVFPELTVKRTLPVELKEIIEWKHADLLEAQVLASGRETFMINFFATDYLFAQDIYEQGGKTDIAVVGICFGVEAATPIPDMADTFCGYMPHSQLPGGMYYSFIGEVLEIADVSIGEEKMKLLDMKLINDPDEPEMFVLPMLVNTKHIAPDNVNIGDRLSGSFWLQGQLA